MATTQSLEVTLETLIESIDLAESIVKRVAEASGFDEDDVHKIGMAVREGVITEPEIEKRIERLCAEMLRIAKALKDADEK